MITEKRTKIVLSHNDVSMNLHVCALSMHQFIAFLFEFVCLFKRTIEISKIGACMESGHMKVHKHHCGLRRFWFFFCCNHDAKKKEAS